MLKTKHIHFFILLALLLSTGCISSKIYREVHAVTEAKKLNKNSQYLKAHMKDGKVYVLHHWQVDEEKNLVAGYGKLFNVNRRLIKDMGKLSINIDDVALFETNKVHTSSDKIAALAVMTGITAAVAVFCIINPKACFGSCPTFYASDGDTMVLQAEGFSSSIAPSLEDKDIDMLYLSQPKSRDMELRVTNEAMETHVIRYADILAAPRPAGGRVFATSEGKFLEATELIQPDQCLAPEGDCRKLVQSFDETERYSPADSNDLAEKEIIELTFQSLPEGDFGLVIGSRQTLLTTFLLYQGYAYLGNSVTYWLSRFERRKVNPDKSNLFLRKLLGGIEVQIQNEKGKWEVVEEVYETGPIASDVIMVPLPEVEGKDVKLRLKMAKGLWRINYLALAKLGGQVEPLRIQPYEIHGKDGIDERALQKLLDTTEALITMPGDVYTLKYYLPEGDYELFLESKGYYLEWMRDEWIAEQDLKKAMMIYLRPSAFLRSMAPHYKKAEPQMEEIFWNSRYVTQ